MEVVTSPILDVVAGRQDKLTEWTVDVSEDFRLLLQFGSDLKYIEALNI